MQVNNNNSPSFQALIVPKDVKAKLKASNLSRKELEFLKDAKELLEDTKYFQVTLQDRDSFIIESAKDAYFGSYKDNMFGINKIAEGYSNILNLGCDTIRHLYSVMKFQCQNRKPSYIVLGNRGSMNDSIYDLPEVARVVKSLDNAARGLNNDKHLKEEMITNKKLSEEINREIDLLF